MSRSQTRLDTNGTLPGKKSPWDFCGFKSPFSLSLNYFEFALFFNDEDENEKVFHFAIHLAIPLLLVWHDEYSIHLAEPDRC